MNETAQRIITSAEAMIREGGYYGFSFRQIADELSIKSASVHYHFPTKEALGSAVAENYTERFVQQLGDFSDQGAIQHYLGLFTASLKNDGRACLCGILAGEAGKIPESLRIALQEFSQKNVTWLQGAFAQLHPQWTAEECRKAAMIFFSSLEGAMVFAALNNRPEHLTEIGESLLQFLSKK